LRLTKTQGAWSRLHPTSSQCSARRKSGEIGGVTVRGYVDLMDANGCIIDLKTERLDHAQGTR